MNKVLTTLITIIAFVTLAAPASATTIDPLSWELLILQADLVAEVQCESAGGIVARYKVVRSWRGPAAGSKVSIRVAVNYWGPQFPVTLCGQRFFVTAFRSPPSTMVSTTSGGGVPLWWRNLRDDYRLPLFQGRLAVNPQKPMELGKLGKLKDAAALDKKLKKLMALNPSQLEARLLWLHTRRAFYRNRGRNHNSPSPHFKRLRRLWQRAKTAQQVLAALAAVSRAHPRKARYRLQRILSNAGGKITLKALASRPWSGMSPQVLDRTAVVAAIKRRLAGKPRAPRPPAPVKAPSKQELTSLRGSLAAGPNDRHFGRALTILSKHDPATVAAYLRAWTPSGKHWGASTMGYSLGSYFSWRCGKQRKKHLTGLIKAKDLYIRVAGAVYLTMEDRKAGVAALRRLARLPGDPGAWAALNLARRGDKAAMPRALKLFSHKVSPGGMAGVPHRNLQKRLLVLLSNAACKAGVKQPLPTAYLPPKPYGPLLAWWKRHQAKLVLEDPWLKVLEKQKMD